ncbi:MAG: flagellar hook basal-body protein [Myxococcota bacterium]
MGSQSYIAASGASTQLRDLDVVANNLANVGTPGFKRSESIFRAVFDAALRDANGDLQPGAPGSTFVQTDLVGTDFARGSAQKTGSPLHAMIDGRGFFEVMTPDGPRYTRAGNFIINATGQLSTPSGQAVMGDGGPIQIGDADVTIHPSGALVDRTGNAVGRLKIVEFQDLHSLEREGQSLFKAGPNDPGTPAVTPAVIPESIEASNVQSTTEMATLVMLQRAFEVNLRSMQVDDQTTQTLIEGIR